ncbi:sensor histidine kinase [Prevotella sp. kh1p2]|uniref:sensor histidine kinase n=1 Tax=Prevotella sp. kh1p2 TaxID=1761883 RepID=UPI000B86EF15|nr:HAMP domain-containing sensor histidine kinase [Prevotella sp. kh1p2]
MMEEQKKYQERIARKVLLRTGGITILFCLFVLVVVGVEVKHVAVRQTVTDNDIFQMLLILCAAICAGAVASLVALYYISRNAARESIQPLTQALEREKAFTSYASHELRTPLAVIKGSLEVLIRKPRTEEEYRRKITESIQVVDRMNEMVDNLLTLTRVESGKLQLIYADYSVSDLMTEACSNYADQLMQRRIKISVDVSPAALTMQTDRSAMLAILSNLISNAAKYCNESGNVNLRATREKNSVLLEVENSGPGIPKAEAEQVFDPFYRSIATGSQKVKGYGLGLAIVRRMTDLLGGKVSLTSSSEGPTIVQVRLPARRNVKKQ